MRSAVHPDTGLIIPFPFRFSFAVPGNLVLVTGMLTATTVRWEGRRTASPTAVEGEGRI